MKYKVSRGKPIYGATFQKTGVNFGIFSKHAKSIKLHLYKKFDDIKPFAVIDFNPKVNKTGDIWHIFFEKYLTYSTKNDKKITKNKKYWRNYAKKYCEKLSFGFIIYWDYDGFNLPFF